MKGGFKGVGAAFDGIDKLSFSDCNESRPLKAINASIMATQTYWKNLNTTAFANSVTAKMMFLNKGLSAHPELKDLRPIMIQPHTFKFLE
jgi:hypothetical protein